MLYGLQVGFEATSAALAGFPSRLGGATIVQCFTSPRCGKRGKVTSSAHGALPVVGGLMTLLVWLMRISCLAGIAVALLTLAQKRRVLGAHLHRAPAPLAILALLCAVVAAMLFVGVMAFLKGARSPTFAIYYVGTLSALLATMLFPMRWRGLYQNGVWIGLRPSLWRDTTLLFGDAKTMTVIVNGKPCVFRLDPGTLDAIRLAAANSAADVTRDKGSVSINTSG
jgi:hypothetical protein